MQAAPELAQLADIQEPALQVFWSDRPLVWVILAVLICLLGWWLVTRWRRYQAEAPRRLAISELQACQAADPSAITTLLKRYLKTVGAPEHLLSLTPSAFADFLSQSQPNAQLDWPNLDRLHYQADLNMEECQRYHQLALVWLKSHARGCWRV